MICDVCRTDAITWRHSAGALCDVCKRMAEQGRYANHPKLPVDLQHAPNGKPVLVPFPDGHGARLVWN